ncbi:MAG: c-type cytochrome [Lentisphaeraceae bacterium]|nr:c-type cytochrome [Lentisphaeraceae bacterium]
MKVLLCVVVCLLPFFGNSQELKTLPGFSAKKIYDVKQKSEGSWVSMCFDDKGNLFACDQKGSLYRMQADKNGIKNLTKIKSPGRAHGLLWAYDSLYMMTNHSKFSILHRLWDKDNDGKFEQVDDVLKLYGKGEHGPHAIVKTQDGKDLYVVLGNFTLTPNIPAVGTRNWQEDTLLTHMPDAGGFSANKKAPGGLVLRISPDGKKKKIIASGLRNTYDIALSPQGELFGYDSDADRDAGTPWYRPTRVNHIVSGGEYGWRTGTSKWPDYYIDSLGSVLDVGPGCPTGLIFGTKAKFPAKYRKALFIMDWTYGRIYSVQLNEDGGTYKGKQEIFIQGKPLAVTDMDFGPDGALYFTTGGRGLQSALYRVEYTGSESTETSFPEVNETVKLRREIEKAHNPEKRSIDEFIKHTAHTDRNVRFAARIAIENQGYVFKDAFLKATNADSVLTLAVAMARCAPKTDSKVILNKLLSLKLNDLSTRQVNDLTRCYALTFARLGKTDPQTQQKIGDVFNQVYPHKDQTLNRELCRLLVYLEHPEVLPKTVKVMETSKFTPAEFKTDFIPEYYTGGSAFKNIHENSPNEQGIHFTLMLTNQKLNWTPELATRVMEWLVSQYDKIGGRCYSGYLGEIRRRIIENLDPESKKAAVKITLYKPSFDTSFEAPKGPGRAWTVDSSLELTKALKGDPINGKKMYQAVLCAKCHFKDGKGGEIGPDLSTLHTRYSKRDIIDAIINPSSIISEQFTNVEIQMRSGAMLQGQMAELPSGDVKLAMNPFDLSQTQTLKKKDILKIKPSSLSPMPPSLINALNPQELADFLAYLTGEK